MGLKELRKQDRIDFERRKLCPTVGRIVEKVWDGYEYVYQEVTSVQSQGEAWYLLYENAHGGRMPLPKCPKAILPTWAQFDWTEWTPV